jgi:hypothetical protein
MDEKKKYLWLSRVLAVELLFLAIGFFIKAYFEPANWWLESAWYPLPVFLTLFIIATFAWAFTISRADQKHIIYSIDIYANGDVKTHRVNDIGLFMWFKKKWIIKNEAYPDE